jgi:hypothetical protein
MIRHFDTIHGRWWRFTEYESHEGYVRPSRKSKIEEFDPWPAYHRALGERGDGHRTSSRPKGPLDHFLDLMGAVGNLPNADAICDWSSRFGPLGLLLERTEFLNLPEGQYVPWSTAHEYQRQPNPTPVSIELATGALLVAPLRFMPFRGRRFESLEGTWAHYFPGVDPKKGYPLWGTEAFRREYAEPFSDWIGAASAFRDALVALGSGSPPSILTPDKYLRARQKTKFGEIVLNSVVRHVSPKIALTHDDAPRLEWSSPTLLSSLGMMGLLNLGGDRIARRCENETCGKLFFSTREDARFCGDKCRWRTQKRTQRKSTSVPRKKTKRRGGKNVS